MQLQKPGAYALGDADRPLTADVIDDAAWRVWAAGAPSVARRRARRAPDVGGVGMSSRPARPRGCAALRRLLG